MITFMQFTICCAINLRRSERSRNGSSIWLTRGKEDLQGICLIDSRLSVSHFSTHPFSFHISRSRKTSITTGVVDRSETIKQETVDRLSPLTSTITISGQFDLQPADADFEKFTVDLDVDSSCLQQHPMQLTVNANANVRRHTVGPGDVAHEQALGNPAKAMNFKFDGASMGPNQIPINLPMLQNQPINTFTVKDQHLLKPPMVMGASEFTVASPLLQDCNEFSF